MTSWAQLCMPLDRIENISPVLTLSSLVGYQLCYVLGIKNYSRSANFFPLRPGYLSSEFDLLTLLTLLL